MKKKNITFKGEEMKLKCSEMTHSSVGGEYEIFFSEDIDFDLDKIWKKCSDSKDYDMEEKKKNTISVFNNDTYITIHKKGRILIQDLIPDTFDEAIKIGESILSIEQQK